MNTETKTSATRKHQAKRCVKCHKGEMGEYTTPKSGVTIDQCQSCGGMWFDKGELESILGPKAVQPFFIASSAGYNDEYQCPRCEVPLAEFNYPGTSTPIDACPKCYGIWLDYKEWTEISDSRTGK